MASSAKRLKHLRGSDSARRYGRDPKVHYRRDSYEGDLYSMCEKTVHGTPTDDPVDCKLCIRIATGGNS